MPTFIIRGDKFQTSTLALALYDVLTHCILVSKNPAVGNQGMEQKNLDHIILDGCLDVNVGDRQCSPACGVKIFICINEDLNYDDHCLRGDRYGVYTSMLLKRTIEDTCLGLSLLLSHYMAITPPEAEVRISDAIKAVQKETKIKRVKREV